MLSLEKNALSWSPPIAALPIIDLSFRDGATEIGFTAKSLIQLYAVSQLELLKLTLISTCRSLKFLLTKPAITSPYIG